VPFYLVFFRYCIAKKRYDELGENKLDLYTALSIFVAAAPKLINGICNAIEAKNLAELEYLAAKLIAYSSQAQLTSFTEKVKNLIIAAREQKNDLVEKQIDSLRYCFEQMARITNATALDERIEVEGNMTC